MSLHFGIFLQLQLLSSEFFLEESNCLTCPADKRASFLIFNFLSHVDFVPIIKYQGFFVCVHLHGLFHILGTSSAVFSTVYVFMLSDINGS